MMSMPRISPHEFEQLSAYLDGQLNMLEAAELQRNLAQRPDLQHALEELRQTRAMLRNAPRRRVPRNFTLKPEMVPARRRVFSRPVFSLGLASALATFFLLLSVMLEFVPTPTLMSAPAAPQSADRSVQATSAAEMSKSAGMGAPTALPTALPTAIPTAAAKSAEATKPAAQPVTAPTATSSNQMRITGDQQPQATPLPPTLPTKPPAPTLAPTAEPTGTGVMLAAPPATQTETPAALDGREFNAPRQEARETLTWLQTLLVVLAAGTGLAALYLRRKR